MGQLGLKPIYLIEDHPLPWLQPLLNGVEHANFFETRATEYSKGATRGDWNTVWTNFDSRRKVTKANDLGLIDDGSEPGLFGEGVAAE
jgi:ribonucleoside-diphosphate reductase beta chain